MTMREKLIARLQDMGVGCCQYAGDRDVAVEIVDAILDELRGADEGMAEAASRLRYRLKRSESAPGTGAKSDDALAFTAMIDHLRSQR